MNLLLRTLGLLSVLTLGACKADADAECAAVEEEVQAFLEDNRACTVDADCTQLGSECFVDDCTVVAVNVSADPQEWSGIDGELAACQAESRAECNYVGECAVDTRCGDAGLCEVF